MIQKDVEHQVQQILQLLGPQDKGGAQTVVTALVVAMNKLVLPAIQEMTDKLIMLENRVKTVDAKLAQIDKQQEQIEDLQTTCESLKAENTKLRDGLRKASQLSLANKKHSYHYNLLLHGIREDLPQLDGATDARNPKFRSAILHELQMFNKTITDTDFELAHRLGPPRPPDTKTGVVAPRAIVIKFYNRYLKEKLLEKSVKRYRAWKLGQGAGSSSAANFTAPYLTSHRVRDTLIENTQQENPSCQASVNDSMNTRKDIDSKQRSAKRMKQLRQRKGQR